MASEASLELELRQPKHSSTEVERGSWRRVVKLREDFGTPLCGLCVVESTWKIGNDVDI